MSCVGMESLFALCTKSLEKQGVRSFVNALNNVNEDVAFNIICTSLLKLNTFSKEEKIELIDMVETNSPHSNNTSFGSDIEMGSSTESFKSSNEVSFVNPVYADLVSILSNIFDRSEHGTVNTPGFDDRTLLHAAANATIIPIQQQRRLIHLLLSYDGLCTVQDIHGNTPLHDAVGNRAADIVETLLSYKQGWDAVNIQNARGNTPLHCLIEWCLQADHNVFEFNKTEIGRIINALCNAGADIKMRNKAGKSIEDLVRMLCLQMGNQEIFVFLKIQKLND